MDWSIDKAATLLMWSGSEVTQAILGNMRLHSELIKHIHALDRVCDKQDSEEDDSLQPLKCNYCTALVAINFVYVIINACL